MSAYINKSSFLLFTYLFLKFLVKVFSNLICILNDLSWHSNVKEVCFFIYSSDTSVEAQNRYLQLSQLCVWKQIDFVYPDLLIKFFRVFLQLFLKLTLQKHLSSWCIHFSQIYSLLPLESNFKVALIHWCNQQSYFHLAISP